jgi:PBP1b-binding outer membrane lipoprotein LpoB
MTNKTFFTAILLSLLLAACSKPTAPNTESTVPTTPPVKVETIQPSTEEETVEEVINQEEDTPPTPVSKKTSMDSSSLDLSTELTELDKEIGLGTGTDDISDSDFSF